MCRYLASLLLKLDISLSHSSCWISRIIVVHVNISHRLTCIYRHHQAKFTHHCVTTWNRTQAYNTILDTLAPNWSSSDRSRVRQIYTSANYKYPSNLGGWCKENWWMAIRQGTDTVPGLGPCSHRNLARLLVNGGTPSVRVYLFSQVSATLFILSYIARFEAVVKEKC